MPLFMMLHYVPPHEPYSPAPRFDLFGAADYRGTANGELQTLRAIDSGELLPTRDDLEEIVSLYDGNLRMADEAVELVLRTLQRRDRWTRTAVLVVSDHGEAFHEHGRMGHNSTVYEEMLRVPFILRLPAGERPSRVDTEMLVSLEDIVPTLLGLAGVRPASELSGGRTEQPGPGQAHYRGLPGPVARSRTERGVPGTAQRGAGRAERAGPGGPTRAGVRTVIRRVPRREVWQNWSHGKAG